MYDDLVLKLVVAGMLMILMLVFFLVCFIISHNNVMRQYLVIQQDLIIKERELVLLEVSENIHDNLTQVLHLIRRNLHTVRKYSSSLRQQKVIDQVAELTERVIRDAKDISHSLNGDFIKRKGLYAMIEFDSDLINATKQISCLIEVQGDNYDLPIESQLLIYRIAQESINNILQHAKAKNILIRLTYELRQFKMEIEDDGIGFNKTAAMDKGMMGLRNMYQRAALLNGCLDICPGQQNGSVIILSVPLRPVKQKAALQ